MTPPTSDHYSAPILTPCGQKRYWTPCWISFKPLISSPTSSIPYPLFSFPLLDTLLSVLFMHFSISSPILETFLFPQDLSSSSSSLPVLSYFLLSSSDSFPFVSFLWRLFQQRLWMSSWSLFRRTYTSILHLFIINEGVSGEWRQENKLQCFLLGLTEDLRFNFN